MLSKGNRHVGAYSPTKPCGRPQLLEGGSRVSGRGNVLSTTFTHSACENTQEAAVLGACSEASAMPSQKSARSTTSCVVAVEGGPGWDASPTRTPRMGQPAQRSNLGTGRLMTRRRHLLRRGRPCQGLPQAALSALVACRLWWWFSESRCVKPASVLDGLQLSGGRFKLPFKVPNHSSSRSMAPVMLLRRLAAASGASLGSSSVVSLSCCLLGKSSARQAASYVGHTHTTPY